MATIPLGSCGIISTMGVPGGTTFAWGIRPSASFTLIATNVDPKGWSITCNGAGPFSPLGPAAFTVCVPSNAEPGDYVAGYHGPPTEAPSFSFTVGGTPDPECAPGPCLCGH